MAGRMASRFGKPFCGAAGLTHIFPAPEVLAHAPLGDIGLTGARVETIRALARAVCNGKIRFEEGAGSESFLNRLCKICRHRKVDRAIRGHARARRARCISLQRSRAFACHGSRELPRFGVTRRSLEALARLRRYVSVERVQPTAQLMKNICVTVCGE